MSFTKKSEITIKQIHPDNHMLPSTFLKSAMRGYKNNTSLAKLKFNELDCIKFFGVIYNDEIREMSGVHRVTIDGVEYWRIGFRAISLLDKEYQSIGVSRDLRLNSYGAGVILPLQCLWAQKHFNAKRFILTTNVEDRDAGKSHRLNKTCHSQPWMHYIKEVQLYNEMQTIWLYDLQECMNIYHKLLASIIIEDDILRL